MYPISKTVTGTPSTTGETITQVQTQTAVALSNTGSVDLELSIGGYENVIIHPNQTWTQSVLFKSFTIKGIGDAGEYSAVLTNAGTAPATLSELPGNNGFLAIPLLNNTGATSIKGTIVQLDTAANLGVKVAVVDCDMPIGVVYESGIAAGEEMWVVISGVADVLMKDTVAAVRGYVAICSTVAGRADVSATVPAAATHDREIGHVLKSETGGTNVLAKMVLHFR